MRSTGLFTATIGWAALSIITTATPRSRPRTGNWIFGGAIGQSLACLRFSTSITQIHRKERSRELGSGPRQQFSRNSTATPDIMAVETRVQIFGQYGVDIRREDMRLATDQPALHHTGFTAQVATANRYIHRCELSAKLRPVPQPPNPGPEADRAANRATCRAGQSPCHGPF